MQVFWRVLGENIWVLVSSCAKLDILVHSLVKNRLVLTMGGEHQKLSPHEIGPETGHLSTQFSKELPCVGHG